MLSNLYFIDLMQLFWKSNPLHNLDLLLGQPVELIHQRVDLPVGHGCHCERFLRSNPQRNLSLRANYATHAPTACGAVQVSNPQLYFPFLKPRSQFLFPNIFPVRIPRIDKINLLFPWAAFYLFFPIDRIIYISELLKIDQFVNFVLGGESRKNLCLCSNTRWYKSLVTPV